MSNKPTAKNFPKWFDPRNRQTGTWAFILNRVTAIGLVIYLTMHLVVLSLLTKGPEAYDGFVALAHSPLVKIGEMLVITAGILHGLNGIRIGLTGIGIGVRHQKLMLFGIMGLGLIIISIFAWAMFLAK